MSNEDEKPADAVLPIPAAEEIARNTGDTARASQAIADQLLHANTAPPPTAAAAEAIARNTAKTAEATSKLLEKLAPPPIESDLPPPSTMIPPGIPRPPGMPRPGVVPPSQGVADIAALTRAAQSTDAAAVKAGADVVAGINSAAQKARVNLLWEGTQAFLAIALTSATIVAAFRRDEIPSTLTNALFVVLGFYFGRTNFRPSNTTTTTTSNRPTLADYPPEG